MHCVNSVATAARALVVAVMLTAGAPGLMAAAQTGADNVQVMVCPQPSESSLTVTAPHADSVVGQPKVTVIGAVEYISQIDFFIDGTYNHTQALGYEATHFTSIMTLSPGTHTLKLVASDSCSQTTHERTIVLTYEPKVLPSVGAAVNTTVDDKLVDAALPELVQEPTFFETYILSPFVGLVDGLDLVDPPSDSQTASPLPSAGRAALFVSGAVIALTGTYIATATTLPAVVSFVLPYRRWFEWVAFALAATVFGVVFTL